MRRREGRLSRAVVFLFALLAVGSGCEYQPIEEKATFEKNVIVFSDSELSFALVKERIFEPSCISCHSQYSSYESVRIEAGRIQSRMDAGDMPLGGPPLALRLRDLFRQWIAAGAPQFPGEAAPPPLPLSPDWTSLQLYVFAPKCQTCHRPEGQARFLDLSTFAAVQNASDRIFNFDHPEQSLLLEVIQDPSEPMPPRSSGIVPVTPEQIQTLTAWIRLRLPSGRP